MEPRVVAEYEANLEATCGPGAQGPCACACALEPRVGSVQQMEECSATRGQGRRGKPRSHVWPWGTEGCPGGRNRPRVA